MADDLQFIKRFVAALGQRERRLLVVASVARLAIVAAMLLVVAAIGARASWDRSTALMFLVVIGAAGLWVGAWVPLFTRWRAATDPVRQARHVEALHPELRGRLLTAVSAERDAASASAPLLARVVGRAAEVVRRVALRRVHPGAHVVRTAALAAACWLVAIPVTFIAPGGPLGLVRFVLGGADARAALAALQIGEEEADAHVGDLALEYVYPDYTGLDPVRVANTTGDAHGPPGTVVRVSARTADAVEAAGLMAYERVFDAVVDTEGRVVSGQFEIGVDPGTWRLVLYRGGEPERSRPFEIAPEADLPPEVILEAESDVIEVPMDGGVALQWRARDDFGVRKAVLHVGERQDQLLFQAERRQAEAWADLITSPQELGLSPGDEVDLVVSAWDNDTVSGSKEGTSRAIRLVVLGAMGRDARREERHQDLEKLMVPILARALTDKWPPGSTGKDMVRWGEQVAHRYEPLQEEVERSWRGMSEDALDLRLVNKVVVTGRDLVRYTQVAFQPDGTTRPTAADVIKVRELADEAVVAIENALLAFLRERQAQALARVERKADEISLAASLLREALERENPQQAELLARLDQLERMLRELRELTAQLASGPLKSFVNQRADEMSGLLMEIRQAIADGRMEDAQRLMQRLAQQLDELSAGIRADMEERRAQAQASQDEAQQLIDRLADLERSQREMQAEVRALREESDGEAAQKAAALWERIAELTAEAATAGAQYREELSDAKRPFYERERASVAVEALDALRSAVRARDILGSREAVGEARHQWIVVQRSALGLTDRRTELSGPRPEVAAAVEAKLREIDALLEQLDRATAGADPNTIERARELRDRQRDLENQLEQVAGEAEEVGRTLSVAPEGMNEALDEAGQRMQQAGDDLGGGRTMAAEGSQGVAAERIRRARSTLEQALQAARSQGQGRGGQGEGQQQNQGREGADQQSGGDQMAGRDVAIPGREAYESPEAYRKALIEGMQGEVPEAYRAWKKRYYEELVRQ